MTTPLLVKISRDGKEIGTYEAKEAVRLLVYGTLKETDFYWHEGMTDWAPLVKLQASEARKQLAERALQQKQEEARRAEQLAKDKAEKEEQAEREKAKAKEEEDRAVAEATRIRLEKEKANWFKCHCCRSSFPKPSGAPSDDDGGGQVVGVIILLVAMLAGLSTGLGLVGAMLFGMTGLAMYWGPAIRSRLPSLCPHCKSTNFSRPEKTDDQK
jgi:hypothetical protein